MCARVVWSGAIVVPSWCHTAHRVAASRRHMCVIHDDAMCALDVWCAGGDASSPPKNMCVCVQCAHARRDLNRSYRMDDVDVAAAARAYHTKYPRGGGMAFFGTFVTEVCRYVPSIWLV